MPSDAHLEASLIKIIDVFVQDPILGLNVAYKIEPGPNNSWVTAQDSLVIPLSCHLRFDLRSPAYKPVGLVFSNLATTTYS
jgi:hypothetical protein